MRNFESEYRIWLNKHITRSTGERLRRIKERHGFGEKLLIEHAWWPVVKSLDDLHPEYEFVDTFGNYYFMDLAYIRLPRPTCLESDSFSSHARDADRGSFSRGLERQNEIALADWNILRFSIDKLKEDPYSCQNHIRRMLEIWYGEDSSSVQKLTIYQREILRLANRLSSPITIEMVSNSLGKSKRVARVQLHQMAQLNYIEPASGDQRVRSYRLKR
ncbi:hypothetical protein KCTCHS21_51410 [Cohnella abietis]|uniref:Uncharacterized protein n=2 Tax=Cohnella abietis TaxID=2507935 RepID=A0A3T1DCB4_9BACL|nr:hypothetical protein KCTCHS21_51410 [Cohnella abietis]